MSDVKADLENSDLTESTTFDAQQLAEEIDTGEQEAPKVNVESDYEKAKQFSVPGVDARDTQSTAANDATTPEDNTNTTPKVQASARPSGDPETFRSMAKEVQRDLADHQDQ